MEGVAEHLTRSGPNRYLTGGRADDPRSRGKSRSPSGYLFEADVSRARVLRRA